MWNLRGYSLRRSWVETVTTTDYLDELRSLTREIVGLNSAAAEVYSQRRKAMRAALSAGVDIADVARSCKISTTSVRLTASWQGVYRFEGDPLSVAELDGATPVAMPQRRPGHVANPSVGMRCQRASLST